MAIDIIQAQTFLLRHQNVEVSRSSLHHNIYIPAIHIYIAYSLPLFDTDRVYHDAKV